MSDDSAAAPRSRRLLWINQFAVPPDASGGTRHYEFARSLVGAGWSVRIAASDFNYQTRRFFRRHAADDRTVHSETIEGVQFDWHWSLPYRRNDMRRILNWVTFARSVVRDPRDGWRPDVVIGSSPHLFAGCAGAMVARSLGVPFVLEVRDLWPESLAVSGRRGLGYWALWLLARHLYRRADRIVVLAEGTRSYLAAIVPSDKLVFAPNGARIDGEVGLGDPGELDGDRSGRRNREAGGSTFMCVYAGAHGPANGLETVVHAARILESEGRDVSILLIGDGPAKRELVDEARSLGISSVQFRDAVPGAEIQQVLSLCDAGLMVLRDVELFTFGVSPNKLFEYWRARLPVVCNVRGEIESLVAQSRGGIQTRDSSAEALAQAIRELMQTPRAQRREMGRWGREWLEANRDTADIARELSDALVAIL